MNIENILSQLVDENGISGNEYPVSKKAAEILKEYLDVQIDEFGNVYGTSKDYSKNKKTLLLDAHIDEIGMIVTYITDDGFLKVSSCGGIDTRLLLAQEVDVLCKQRIKGVITSTPPHLEKDSSKAPEIDEIYVDIGMSKENAEKVVSLGDRIFINNSLAYLKNDFVTAKSLDDRSGIAAIIYCLDLLKDKQTQYNIKVLFSVQEEVGERGAKIGAYNIDADMAVAVDVSFARTNGESADKCGEISKGPMIGIAPSLSREMSDLFIETAKKNHIPYQIEVMNGKTGTNADTIGITKSGVKTCTISIPLKYMHTPVESVSISDVKNIGKLLAKFCELEDVEC
ncbi:MAG: M20/M25/M40 family metallo-hydrolase [Ruminococcus sp.]|nr:M20/M25/M40 family metallo-hydrolase [Ruminococcus sp.]